jgi:hypothetical protein
VFYDSVLRDPLLQPLFGAAMQRSPEFLAIARRFAGLIEFEPHQCEVVHVGQRNASA